MTSNRNSSKISNIERQDGTVIQDIAQIKEYVVQYFQELLGGNNTQNTGLIHSASSYIESSITMEQANWMCREVI
ncbi:unnamed protein product, partial [Ilex paraguariensis]